jgi:RND superfamily putative drug exporter
VFLGFVTDPDVLVKTIGFGLAVAILIDVTIVRLVVAPAVMALLGDRAWGLPAWLDRILPKISLEGEDRVEPGDRSASAPGRRPAPAGAGAR